MARRSRGSGTEREPKIGKIRPDSYAYLPIEAVKARKEELEEKLQDAIAAYQEQVDIHNRDTPGANAERLNNFVASVNRYAYELEIVNKELEKREKEENKERDKENEYFDDLAEDQVEGLREKKQFKTKEELGDFTLKAQNALNRKLGRDEFDDFNDFWNEVKGEKRSQEKKIKERDEKEIQEKNDATLKAHNEAFDRGEVERKYSTYDDLQEAAIKNNENLNEAKGSSEYQVGQRYKETFNEIDDLVKKYEKRVEDYENKGLWGKIKAGFSGDRSYAKECRKWIETLKDGKADILYQEKSFIEEKDQLQKRLVSLTGKETDLSKLDMENPPLHIKNLQLEIDKAREKIAILVENHKEKMEEIAMDLSETSREGFIKLPEIEEREPDFKSIESTELATDELIFRKEEEEKLKGDRVFQDEVRRLKISLKTEGAENMPDFGGGNLKDFIKFTPETEIGKRIQGKKESYTKDVDELISREIENYERKILEARVRMRRIAQKIEEEKQKSPAEMNLAAVSALYQRINVERVNLTKYEESIRQKVVILGKREDSKRLFSKFKGWMGAKG